MVRSLKTSLAAAFILAAGIAPLTPAQATGLSKIIPVVSPCHAVLIQASAAHPVSRVIAVHPQDILPANRTTSVLPFHIKADQNGGWPLREDEKPSALPTRAEGMPSVRNRNPIALRSLLVNAATNGSWWLVTPHQRGRTPVDPATADYEVTLFVDVALNSGNAQPETHTCQQAQTRILLKHGALPGLFTPKDTAAPAGALAAL